MSGIYSDAQLALSQNDNLPPTVKDAKHEARDSLTAQPPKSQTSHEAKRSTPQKIQRESRQLYRLNASSLLSREPLIDWKLLAFTGDEEPSQAQVAHRQTQDGLRQEVAKFRDVFGTFGSLEDGNKSSVIQDLIGQHSGASALTNTELDEKCRCAVRDVLPALEVAGEISDNMDQSDLLDAEKDAGRAAFVAVTALRAIYPTAELVERTIRHIRLAHRLFSHLEPLEPEAVPRHIKETAVLASDATLKHLVTCLKFLRQHLFQAVFDGAWPEIFLEKSTEVLTEAVGNLRVAILSLESVWAGYRGMHQSMIGFLDASRTTQKHTNIAERRVTESMQWFLDNENFQQWRSGVFSTLICSGEAGVGKTFVSSVVTDHLRKYHEPEAAAARRVWVGCIYFEHDRSYTQTFSRITASLIGQLCQMVDTETPRSAINLELINLLETLYEHRFGRDFEAHLDALRDVLAVIGKCVVVIDALDESVETDVNGVSRQDFVKGLTLLPVSFFFTSRDSQTVKSLLSSEDAARHMSMRTSTEVLKAYVDWRMRDPKHGSQKLQEFLEVNGDVRDEIVTALSREPESINFNLACHHINTIAGTETVDATRRALQQISWDTTVVYNRVIDSIKARPDGGANAFMALAWIYSAKRPLQMVELRHALVSGVALDSDVKDLEGRVPEKKSVLDWCQGLVEYSAEFNDLLPKDVLFVHHTVRKYFDARPDILGPYLEKIPRLCIDHWVVGTLSDNIRTSFYIYASRFWMQYVRNPKHGAELFPHWSPVFRDERGMNGQWVRVTPAIRIRHAQGSSPKELIKPIDFASCAKEPWLLNFLISDDAQDLRVTKAEALKAIARYNDGDLAKYYGKLIGESRPSPREVAALIHSKTSGIAILEKVFSQFPNYHIGNDLLTEASSSEGIVEMWDILWKQHTKTTAATLPAQSDQTLINPLLMTLAVGNSAATPGLLTWLRREVGVPLSQDTIIALARYHPQYALVWALEDDIAAAPLDLIRNMAHGGREVTRPYSTLRQTRTALSRLSELGELVLNASFVGQALRVGARLSQTQDTFDLSWLLEQRGVVTMTPEGGRALVRKGDVKAVLDVFSMPSMTVDFVLAALDEVHTLLKPQKLEEAAVSPQSASKHPDDGMALSRPRAPPETNLTMEDYQALLGRTVLRELSETQTLAMIDSKAPNIAQAKLQVLFGTCDSEPLLEPSSIKEETTSFLSDEILRCLGMFDDGLDAQFIRAFATESNSYLRRPALCDDYILPRPERQEACQRFIITSQLVTKLSHKYLIATPEQRQDCLDTMIDSLLLNLRVILELDLFSMESLTCLPADIYTKATLLTGPDADFVHTTLQRFLAERDRTWSPPLTLFEDTALRFSLETFAVLQLFNKSKDIASGPERTAWRESVLCAAVQNPSEDAELLVRYVLTEREHDDFFEVRDARELALQSGRRGRETADVLDVWKGSQRRAREKWENDNDLASGGGGGDDGEGPQDSDMFDSDFDGMGDSDDEMHA